MNIQHLESLSDVVANITGVQVRERVPDTVLSRADDVLLVDLSPAELIERLKEGKVYLPENAQRAVDSFFRIGNLTALARDGAAAHRRPSRRPDGRLSQAERHRGALADGRAAAGVHRPRCAVGKGCAHRRAAGVRASTRPGWWCRSNAPTARRCRPRRASGWTRLFNLAESLGAETRRVVGSDFVEEILRLARREHATQIVIGGRRQRFPARCGANRCRMR